MGRTRAASRGSGPGARASGLRGTPSSVGTRPGSAVPWFIASLRRPPWAWQALGSRMLGMPWQRLAAAWQAGGRCPCCRRLGGRHVAELGADARVHGRDLPNHHASWNHCRCFWRAHCHADREALVAQLPHSQDEVAGISDGRGPRRHGRQHHASEISGLGNAHWVRPRELVAACSQGWRKACGESRSKPPCLLPHA